eukprot:353339-Chlamydomonas_euryale.AAC.3
MASGDSRVMWRASRRARGTSLGCVHRGDMQVNASAKASAKRRGQTIGWMVGGEGGEGNNGSGKQGGAGEGKIVSEWCDRQGFVLGHTSPHTHTQNSCTHIHTPSLCPHRLQQVYCLPQRRQLLALRKQLRRNPRRLLDLHQRRRIGVDVGGSVGCVRTALDSGGLADCTLRRRRRRARVQAVEVGVHAAEQIAHARAEHEARRNVG